MVHYLHQSTSIPLLRSLRNAVSRSSYRPLSHLAFCSRRLRKSGVAIWRENVRPFRPYDVAAAAATVRYSSSKPILDCETILSALEQASQYDTVYVVQQKLMDFHEVSGLPWWAVVVSSALVVRTFVVLPLAVYQQHVLFKLAHVRRELSGCFKAELSQSLYAATKEQQKRDDAGSISSSSADMESKFYDELGARRDAMYKKFKCRPPDSVVPGAIQVALWMWLSGAVYNVSALLPIRDSAASEAFAELRNSGFWLFTDLTVADSTFVLPCLIVLLNWRIIQLHHVSGLHAYSYVRILAFGAARCLVVASLPVMLCAPKCLTLYWFTSSVYGLVQNMCFLSPKARKFLRLPPLVDLGTDPLKNAQKRFRSWFYLFKY